MRNLILFSLLAGLIHSCKPATPPPKKITFPLPPDSLIYEVIQATIDLDSLDVLKTSDYHEPVQQNLCLYSYWTPGTIHSMTDFDINQISKDSLRYNDGRIDRSTFSVDDTLFMHYQIEHQKPIYLPRHLFPTLRILADSALHKVTNGEREIHQFFAFYVPLFSADLTTAYVQIDGHCDGLCGSGWTVVLKKINGKWTRLEKWGRWIS